MLQEIGTKQSMSVDWNQWNVKNFGQKIVTQNMLVVYYNTKAELSGILYLNAKKSDHIHGGQL